MAYKITNSAEVRILYYLCSSKASPENYIITCPKINAINSSLHMKNNYVLTLWLVTHRKQNLKKMDFLTVKY